EVDDTDRRPLAQHRNAEHGANAADLYRVPEGEFRVGEHVVNMDDLAFFDGSSDQRPSSGRNRVSRHEGRMLGRLAVVGDLLECAAMLAIDVPERFSDMYARARYGVLHFGQQ